MQPTPMVASSRTSSTPTASSWKPGGPRLTSRDRVAPCPQHSRRRSAVQRVEHQFHLPTITWSGRRFSRRRRTRKRQQRKADDHQMAGAPPRRQRASRRRRRSRTSRLRTFRWRLGRSGEQTFLLRSSTSWQTSTSPSRGASRASASSAPRTSSASRTRSSDSRRWRLDSRPSLVGCSLPRPVATASSRPCRLSWISCAALWTMWNGRMRRACG
mmetsp:Transcript_66984/g.188636  ORF Transcript_66984/g.188636 Transcript_66984/m.188636 type:complete len:214 (+) Transcript_66984:624-1265(+)